jgi:hypothetical protein
MDELDKMLPMPVAGDLNLSDLPERFALLRPGITEPAGYLAFAAGKERFEWMRDPSGRTNTEGIPDPGFGTRSGPVWWFLRITQRRTDWRVEKAIEWKSMEAARMAAGMEWVGRHGYIVELRADRAVVGPSLADFQDPARYLTLGADRLDDRGFRGAQRTAIARVLRSRAARATGLASIDVRDALWGPQVRPRLTQPAQKKGPVQAPGEPRELLRQDARRTTQYAKLESLAMLLPTAQNRRSLTPPLVDFPSYRRSSGPARPRLSHSPVKQ